MLFSPLKIRDLEIPNRIWLSSLCQYSATDGVPNDWHLVHLGRYATAKVGLIMTEASGIAPDARSTLLDAGIWNEEQELAWKKIVTFVHAQGAKIGIQLWHAGQKGSTTAPWQGQGHVSPAEGGWIAVAPSAVAFGELPAPLEITKEEMQVTLKDYQESAQRALRAGFDVLEIHAAHGYLIHSFLSPITNKREDEYGGSFENRIRFAVEVVEAVREVWPSSHPLFIRTSAHDWVEGGWTTEDNAELAEILFHKGVDLIDCSSGGIKPDVSYPVGPGYQVQFSEMVKKRSKVLACAVGVITEPLQAEAIIASQQADAVMLGREFLRDPHWVFRAAKELDVDIEWLNQYKQAKPKK